MYQKRLISECICIIEMLFFALFSLDEFINKRTPQEKREKLLGTSQMRLTVES